MSGNLTTNSTTPVTPAIPRIDKYSAFKAPPALWPYDRNSAVQYSNLITFDSTR